MMTRQHMTLLLILFLAMITTTVALAGGLPERARTLLRERDHLQQQLLRVDQAAVDAMLRGEDPVELFADQTGLQEQVDMLQMRLESLAMRLNFDIPPLLSTIEHFDPNAALETHIAIGRQRANAALTRRCGAACGSILEEVRFDVFLDF